MVMPASPRLKGVSNSRLPLRRLSTAVSRPKSIEGKSRIASRSISPVAAHWSQNLRNTSP